MQTADSAEKLDQSSVRGRLGAVDTAAGCLELEREGLVHRIGNHLIHERFSAGMVPNVRCRVSRLNSIVVVAFKVAHSH